MKKLLITSTLLFISNLLLSQGIKLEEGEEFHYSLKLYHENETLTDDNDWYPMWTPDNKSEEFSEVILDLRVDKVSVDGYRIIGKMMIPFDYRRIKSKDSNWRTRGYYFHDLRDSASQVERRLEFTLTRSGEIIDTWMDGDYGNALADNRARPIFNRMRKLFFSIDYPVVINGTFRQESVDSRTFSIDYRVVSKTDEMILLEGSGEHENTEMIDKLFVNKRGIVHDRQTYFKRRSDAPLDSYLAPEITGTRNSRMENVRLIKEDTMPVLYRFEVDNVLTDTIFPKVNSTLSGKLLNAHPSDSIYLAWSDPDNPINWHRYKLIDSIEEDGNFELKIFLDKKQLMYLHYGTERLPLYVLPGDEVFIELDANNYSGSAKATGIGSDYYNFMFAKNRFELQNDLSYSRFEKERMRSPRLKPDEFKEISYEILNEKESFLKNYKWKVPGEIYLAEYWYYHQLFVESLIYYHDSNSRFFRPTGKQNTETFFDFDNLIHADNDLMSHASYYDSFIKIYIFAHYQDKIRDQTGVGNVIYGPVDDNFYNSSSLTKYQFAHSVTSGITQQVLKYSTVSDAFLRADWEVFIQLFERFKEEYPLSPKTKLLEILYEKGKKVRPGQPAYNFELRNYEGKTIQLSDFKGKVVYLNFWEPWCCGRPNLYTEKADSLLTDKGVEVIYIAFDPTGSYSEQYLKEYNLRGTKLWADDAERSKLLDKYLFRNLSHSIIIDADGRIFNRNAPKSHSVSNDIDLVLRALDPG